MSAIIGHKIGRILTMRLGPGEDLLRGILESCQKHGFQNAALLSGIGSLKEVRVFNESLMSTAGQEIVYGYEQEPRAWGGRQGVMELCSVKGFIHTDKFGKFEHHFHVTFSNSAGAVLGGCLAEGSLVNLTAEIVVGELL